MVNCYRSWKPIGPLKERRKGLLQAGEKKNQQQPKEPVNNVFCLLKVRFCAIVYPCHLPSASPLQGREGGPGDGKQVRDVERREEREREREREIEKERARKGGEKEK